MLRAALRSLLQHKLRLSLTLLAVVVGVAFVAGTFIFTDSLKKSFDALFEAPQPDVIVSAGTAGSPGSGGGGGPSAGDQVATLPSTLVDQVGAVDGAAAAYGIVAADGAIIIGADGTVVGEAGPPARGTTWVPDAAINPLTLASGDAPTGRDQVALLEATADAAGRGGRRHGADRHPGRHRAPDGHRPRHARRLRQRRLHPRGVRPADRPGPAAAVAGRGHLRSRCVPTPACRRTRSRRASPR